MTLNRRDFIKKASLGAAVVAGSSFLIGCNNTEATAPAPAPETWDLETDVVVAGGGNGGLSAAAAAAESGKKVILCEISAFLGGGSAYSGGTIHSAGCDDWEEYRAHTEDLHDPVLAKKYVETFRQEYIPWLQNNGIPLTRHPGGKLWQSDWGMGSGEQGYLRHKAYFDALAAYAESKGTTIMTQTRVLRLVRSAAFKQLKKVNPLLSSLKPGLLYWPQAVSNLTKVYWPSIWGPTVMWPGIWESPITQEAACSWGWALEL